MRAQYLTDLDLGAGWVEIPNQVGKKYPNAGREWTWRWVLPATRHSVDRATGQVRRHHFRESALRRAFRTAVLGAGLGKRASCHTPRHSFATHRPGHRDVSKTMIHAHVLNRGGRSVRGPGDSL